MEADKPTVEPRETLRNLMDLVIAALPQTKLSRRWLHDYRLQYESTADHIARSLGGSIDTVSVSAAAAGEAAFEQRMIELELEPETISRHKGRRGTILRYAKQFNLIQSSPIEQEWEQAAEAAAQEKGGASNIVNFAIALKIHQAEFCQRHVNSWKEGALKKDFTVSSVIVAEKSLRRALRKADLQKFFPAFDVSKRVKPFSLFLDQMEPMLKADVSGIVAAMEAKAKTGTVRIGSNLLSQFEALCGYALNELGMTGVDSIDPLLTEDFLKDYVKWLDKTKKCKRPAIANKLGGLHTVIRTLDRFRGKDFTWWPTLLNKVEPEPESSVKARKRARGMRWVKLLEIPSKMRKHRPSEPELSTKRGAWRLHDELLMTVAVMLVWDSSVIRACHISGDERNLFKRPIPEDRSFLALTPSAIEARKENENLPLWQFDFERIRGIGAYGVLICQVVPLLEKYMDRRHLLIDEEKGDPGTLFLGHGGDPLTKSSFERAVRNLSHAYGEKAVTPESIRNSFVDYWLLEHPKDYINLANILMVSLDSVQVRFDPDYKRQSYRNR